MIKETKTMSNSQKYSLSVQQQNSTWTAKIHRRVSKKNATISKKQADFPTQEAAQLWAEAALKGFQDHQTERDLQHSVERHEKRKQKQTEAESEAKAKAKYEAEN